MNRPPPPRRKPPPPAPPGGMTRPEGAGVPAARASAPRTAEPEVDKDLPQTFFLGRYRVVDEIGVGGMASVHLARVDGPGGFQKWVAIKRIHPHLVEDDQFVDMFLDEARIAAGINHANVAQVFDLGKDDNTYWIAMEYLHGEPLREIMRRMEEKQTRLPFHIAARVCADAAEGLHGAHELRGRNGQLLNLVHRDVTPHNLFVTYDGYTKVVDFGIAKVIDRLASTRAGTLKGKLAYMSPEQVRGQEVDRRTDVFALGVVLWELTTSRRLFRMDTDLDTLEKVQACVVPLPRSIVSDYPTELEKVVMKALAQRREDRFQTAREFSRALQRFLMTQGTFVGPEDVGDFSKQLFEDRVQKRERYLEWAAEVTSTIDVDQLHAQQSAAEQSPPSSEINRPAPPSQSHNPQAPLGSPLGSPLGAPQSPPRRTPPRPPGAPPGSPQQYAPPSAHRSMGQNSATAAVVTSAPELASSSLMDEDEDIPTVVAYREPANAAPNRPRPAAGAPQRETEADEWDGAATQMIDQESDDEELNATIALPDAEHAEQIRLKIEQMTQQRSGQPGPQGAHAAGTPQGGASSSMTPTTPGQGPARKQAIIETNMSLPRPAAVGHWLAEHGDVRIHGPRSTAVITAVALLSTLCVLGVGALVYYKLTTPARTLGELVAPTARTDSDEEADDSDSNSKSSAASNSSDKDGKPKSTKEAAGRKSAGSKSGRSDTEEASSAEKPGTLTVTCRPTACDQVIVGGKALGPSPVFSHSLPPGQHRVTAKGSGVTKTISVVVASGQLTSQRITMK